MGSIMQIMPKQLVIEEPGNPYQQPSYNIGFNNAAGALPTGNGDGISMYGYQCVNGVPVCHEGVENDKGEITWHPSSETSKCRRINQERPGSIEVPNCSAASRGTGASKFKLFDFKTWGTKEYVIAGSAAVLLVGTAWVLIKRAKK